MRAIILIAMFLFMGCTDQICAKNYGGSAIVNMTCGKKLINITWKESDLWIVSRPMTSDDIPETYNFNESSSFGVLEGTITVKECR